MKHPNKPELGMRVIYGRSGFDRTSYKGRVTRTDSNSFDVEWFDLIKQGKQASAITTYRIQAWANTRLDNRWRNRDKHYIFFDETDETNKRTFKDVFNCGIEHFNPCSEISLSEKLEIVEFKLKTLEPASILGVPTLENSMKKTLVKQTLVNGINIKEASNEELIRLITSLEAEAKHLDAIEIESKHINKMIEELGEAIKEVVMELDSRI